MKRALVCGAGGFIGGHLVKKLNREDYWVRGVDIKEHEFAPTQADEFLLLDLREPQNCRPALTLPDGAFDEVYQLAAEMGGMTKTEEGKWRGEDRRWKGPSSILHFPMRFGVTAQRSEPLHT